MRILFCILVSIWASNALAQSAESDRDFITGLIEDSISNDAMTVRLINFQGALSSAATADAITIADSDGIWLRLDGLTIDWNRSALLSGRVEIETLSAERIDLIRLPAPSPQMAELPAAQATPFSLPDLPVSINIANLSADEIVLTEALLGEAITARFEGTLRLGGGEGRTDFTLERTDSKTGRFVVDASYDNTSRQLGLSLLAEEGQSGIAARLLNLPDRPPVRLEIAGDAPLDNFSSTIALATDYTDRVTGTVQVSRPSGSLDQAFNIDVKGDLRPLLSDQYDPFFGATTVLRAEGTVFGLGGMRLSNLVIAADQVVLRGSARIDADGWPEFIDLRGRLGTGGATQVLLPISGTPTKVSGMSLNVQYNVDNGDAWTGAFDITSLTRQGISIDALALSGGGIIVPSKATSRGRFSADLTYAARGFDLESEALSQAIGSDIEGTLDFGRLTGEPFVIRALTFRGAGIQGHGSAYVDGPDDRFRTRAEIALQAEDFSRFAALSGLDISGGGDVTLSGKVDPFDGIFDLNVSAQTSDLAFGIPQVDPLLAGASTLSLQMERDTDGTRLRNIDLRNASVQATGRGEITSQTATAVLTARLADLNLVAPEVSGPATLAADIATNAQGVITLDADITAPQANVTALATASPIEGGYVVRTAASIAVDELRSYGDLIGQPLGGGLSVNLDGVLTTPTRELKADVTARTRDLRAKSDVVNRILAGLGRISANISLSEAGRLRLDALDVAFPNLTANGTVASSGTDTTASLAVRLRDVALLVSDFSGPVVADISARQDAAGWAITGDATGPNNTNARTSGRVSNAGQLNLSVTGSAPLSFANLYIAPRQINGLAQFDLSVNGPPALSSVRGPITISNARLAAPTLQQALEDLNGTLLLAGGTARLDFRAASANGGNLTLTGPVDLSPPFQAALTAGILDIVLRDPALYRTTANGRVTVNGPLAGGAQIAGTIDLGVVDVQVPSTGVSALGKLPDITHLGPRIDARQTLTRAGVDATPTPVAQRTTRSSGPDFPVDLVIRAPSRIFVRGRGLDAELGGQLRLTGSLNNLVPIGRFDLVRGRLSILGQRFELDEGYAQLQGDFAPYLRLVASSEARTGTMVRIVVEGPADDIDVRFESTPELPQDEVLAQLLFGRDLSSISPLQAVQLASAAATLAGAGGGGIVSNLREGLDLDDLDFITDEDGNAAVRAGKYLSENVYTDVTVGANGTSEINLNIDIDRNFTARGSVASDGEASVGIFFERDY